MRIVFAALLLAASAFAQDPASAVTVSCGSKNINLDVVLNDGQATAAQPDPSRTRVYFVQDDEYPGYVVKVGLDGTWVGANKSDSHFSVSVEPGEHHLCAMVQSKFAGRKQIALAHFSAKAGMILYFRTRFMGGTLSNIPAHLDLEPADSDEAMYLIAMSPASVSQPRK